MLTIFEVLEVMSERIELTRDTSLSEEERTKVYEENTQQVNNVGTYLKAVDCALKAVSLANSSPMKNRGLDNLLGDK